MESFQASIAGQARWRTLGQGTMAMYLHVAKHVHLSGEASLQQLAQAGYGVQQPHCPRVLLGQDLHTMRMVVVGCRNSNIEVPAPSVLNGGAT